MTTEHIGQRIRQKRKEINLTQDALAALIGMRQSYIAQLENGIINESTKVASIAHILGVNALWLERGSGKPNLDYVHPVGIPKTYCKEIEEVIKLMESTDDRGRRRALIAVEDTVEAYQARKNSLPRAQSVDELGELSGHLALDLLPESVESEEESNAVYRAENGVVQKDKHH
jgi:transcriptional regulator with XRE-family HTH domain